MDKPSRHRAAGWNKSSRAVQRDSRLQQPLDAAVHNAFAGYMNEYSNTFVGQETIAKLVNRSDRTVRRSIERLKACGYLNEVKRLPRRDGNKAGAGSWQYEVLMEPLIPDPARVDNGASEGRVSDRTNTPISDRTNTPISDRTNELSDRTKTPVSDRTKPANFGVSDRTKSTLRPDKTDAQTGHPCPDNETLTRTRLLERDSARAREAHAEVAAHLEDQIRAKLDALSMTLDVECECKTIAPDIDADRYLAVFKKRVLEEGVNYRDMRWAFLETMRRRQAEFEAQRANDRAGTQAANHADVDQTAAPPAKKKKARKPARPRSRRIPRVSLAWLASRMAKLPVEIQNKIGRAAHFDSRSVSSFVRGRLLITNARATEMEAELLKHIDTMGARH